jgi:hypothetical protein
MSGSRVLSHASMTICCPKFVTFCLCPMEYRLRVVHKRLLIVGTGYKYSRSWCPVRVLVYEHWLVVGHVRSYFKGLYHCIYCIGWYILPDVKHVCVSVYSELVSLEFRVHNTGGYRHLIYWYFRFYSWFYTPTYKLTYDLQYNQNCKLYGIP